MAQQVTTNFLQFLAQKEKRENKRYKISEISRITGIERRRLYNWRDGDVAIYKDYEIVALCDFFNCRPGDLIDYMPPLDSGRELKMVLA